MVKQPSLIRCHLDNTEFTFRNTPTAPFLIREIFSDNYKIIKSGMTFGHGDVIIDLGANEGIFSILMAKMFPCATIISLEPVRRTYRDFIFNMSINNVTNIEPLPFGIAAENSFRDMIISKEHSGGSSSVITFVEQDHYSEQVKCVTLDYILKKFVVQKCKLLKIDIEGMEHEVLLNSDLGRIENIVGEFHINGKLLESGYNIEKLVDNVKARTNLMFYESCRMSE